MKITERAERSVANTIEDENTWPTDDEIRNHAYELFLARRADEPGSELNDWLAATKPEVKSGFAASASR